MKAEDAIPHRSTNVREIDIATAIGRKLVKDAVCDMGQMLAPLTPPGKTVSISTTLCVLFKATVELMSAIDREATNAFLLSVSDGMNGTGEDVQARQLAAQDAMARTEVIKEARSSTRGTA